jgi:hypothetical protein
MNRRRIFSVDRRWVSRVEEGEVNRDASNLALRENRQHSDLALRENRRKRRKSRLCYTCCRRRRSLVLANRVVEELLDHIRDIAFRKNRQHRGRQCLQWRRRRNLVIFLHTHSRL